MRIFDRFFLFLFSILFIIVALFTLLIGLEFFNEIMLQDMTETLYTNSILKITMIITSIVVILLGIYFLIRSIQTEHTPTFTNTSSDIGEIRISIETIETLSSKVASKVRGVREEKVKVKLDDKGRVTIVIKIFVDGEIPIPKISEEIQLNVKDTIEQIAGINVDYVHILVANVGQSTTIKKSRLE